MPFEPIKNPFGGVDEDATIEAAAELCGGKHKLEELSRLYNSSYRSSRWGYGQGKTKEEVFIDRAIDRGFPKDHAEAFLVLTQVA